MYKCVQSIIKQYITAKVSLSITVHLNCIPVRVLHTYCMLFSTRKYTYYSKLG